MQTLTLRDSFIKLGQALKAAGLVESGVEAKEVILAGEVQVNGEICRMRGKKCCGGDEIRFRGETIRIAAGADER